MCNFTHSVEFVLRYGNLRCFCREATFFANLRCFVVRQILSKIYALLRGKFSWPKMRLWKKMTNMRYGQLVVIYGNQWQSLLNFYLIISISVQSVLNFYSFLIISIKFLLIDNQYQPERRRREGQQRTPHDPMNSLSVESLEFLEILRLLKFEDIITMVRSHVGSATPPSVMVLFFKMKCSFLFLNQSQL